MRVKPSLSRKNHLLTVSDFSKEEIGSLLELTAKIKKACYAGVNAPLLKDKVLGMMFDQPSTRTRISFETAMTHLGGHAEFLEFKNLHVGEQHESMRDTAEVISRMVDAICIRTNEQAMIEHLSEYSFVPVINAMSLDYHPTQVLCDLLTMREHLPEVPFEEMTVVIMGDANHDYEHTCGVPVQRSWLKLAAIMGMTLIQCGPEEMWFSESDRTLFGKLAGNSSARLLLTTDPHEHIHRADFLVSDSWWYHGMESEELKEARLSLLSPRYQVNKDLVEKGKESLAVMHCLPGTRDFEITSEVWDGPQSLIFEEAENRLHMEAGLLAWFVRSDERSVELKAQYKGEIEAFLGECRQRFD